MPKKKKPQPMPTKKNRPYVNKSMTAAATERVPVETTEQMDALLQRCEAFGLVEKGLSKKDALHALMAVGVIVIRDGRPMMLTDLREARVNKFAMSLQRVTGFGLEKCVVIGDFREVPGLLDRLTEGLEKERGEFGMQLTNEQGAEDVTLIVLPTAKATEVLRDLNETTVADALNRSMPPNYMAVVRIGDPCCRLNFFPTAPVQ
jgi:hypothetical protein